MSSTYPILLPHPSYPLHIIQNPPNPSSQHPVPTFPFLALPAELRLQIYSHILPSSVRISPARPNLEKSMHPWALTFVSRKIREEVLTMLYAKTEFHLQFHGKGDTVMGIESMESAYEAWITNLDPELGNLIQHITIDSNLKIQKKRKAAKWRKRHRLIDDEEVYYGRFRELQHRFGWRCTVDVVGKWEVRWRDVDLRRVKAKAVLRVLRYIEEERTGMGLGKEGIRALVSAYRDAGWKEVDCCCPDEEWKKLCVRADKLRKPGARRCIYELEG
ncbi:MAG: hypothetical protein Q9204_004730 [Flavoplaca sp. TL-2023a]